LNKFTFKQRWNMQLALVKGALLGYVRDFAALFFTLLFPLIFMVIFGLLNFGSGNGFSEPTAGIADQAQNASSRALIAALESDDVPLIPAVGSEAELLERFNNGDLEILITIPPDFDLFGDEPPAAPSTVALRYEPDQIVALSIAQSVLNETLDELALRDAPPQFRVENYVALGAPQTLARDGRDVSYRVFLIPGILAIAIMQGAVFGIAFMLSRYKAQGVLRRFQGTPAGAAPFLFSEVAARVVVLVVATIFLMAAGMLMFSDYREFVFAGGAAAFLSTLALALIGTFVFLAWALAFTGRTKSENAASAIANLTTFPMLFLSGVFFSTSVLPEWLRPATDLLPLTFLIDALRAVQVDGAALWSAAVGFELLGLAVWAVVLFVAARLLFRWN